MIGPEHVVSRVIDWVAYDEAERRLLLGLTGGRAYAYLDVPRSEHRSLMSAESKGIHYNARIKGAYAYEEITAPRGRAPRCPA